MRAGGLFSILFHIKLVIAAKAIILNKGKVLVLREAKYDEGTNEGRWDVPGAALIMKNPQSKGSKERYWKRVASKLFQVNYWRYFNHFQKLKEQGAIF